MPLVIKLQQECWDNDKQEFFYPEVGTLTLEHSLISISKWEAKWKKPYLGSTEQRTPEEAIDYIRCMSIKGEPTEAMINALTTENVKQIAAYIEDPMTASTVKEDDNSVCGVPKSFTTSELLYSYMIGYGIPVEFEKWHLNRLLILIKILNEQNKDPNKKKQKSERELIREYAKIREANRAKYHIKG